MNATCTAPVAPVARPLTADALLRDVAFALKMARRVSVEIRRDAVVRARRPRPAVRLEEPAMA